MFKEDQAQRVSSRRRKIERLDCVRRPAQTVAHFQKASDGQLETVIAVHSEAPVAGRGNRNRPRGFSDKLVLIDIDGETGKTVVCAKVPRAAGIEVINYVPVLGINGALLGGRADHAFSHRKAGYLNIGLVIPHRKTGDRTLIADPVGAPPPACVTERGNGPIRPKGAVSWN